MTKRKYYAPHTGYKRLPKRSGPQIKKMLAYVASLPLCEGQQVLRQIEITGEIPAHHLNKYLNFLAEQSV